MSTTQQAPRLAPEIEPLVLAVLEARVKDAKAAARASIENRYADGDKVTVRSPLDEVKLGTVYRTDPDPRWEIHDRNALAAHLAADPANLEYVDEISGSDEAVLAVLREHAPHLLARIERVPDSLFHAALAASVSGGIAAAPGIRRVKPRGTLAIRPDKNAGAAIERLVAIGWITYDGRPLLLPAGQEATP